MKLNIIEKIGGTTLKTVAINSGVTGDATWSTIYDATETLVSSVTATSSTNGYNIAYHTMPNSRVWLINQWNQRIGVNTYGERQFIRVIIPDAG